MRYLKQNTDQYVSVGPFLDKTAGLGNEDGLTVTSISGVIVKSTHAGASTHTDFTCSATAANDWGLAAIGHGGIYDLKIPDSEINFVGSAKVALWYDAETLPVWEEFMVLPANVWDALMGTAGLKVDLETIKTQAVTCAAGVTVSPNVGTAQPIGFTGTGAAALAKTDVVDWKGSAAPDLDTAEDIAATVNDHISAAIDAPSPDTNTATSFKTTLPSGEDDFYNDMLLTITSGALIKQVKKVTNYDGTSKVITVGTGFTSTPVDGVTFDLVHQ